MASVTGDTLRCPLGNRNAKPRPGTGQSNASSGFFSQNDAEQAVIEKCGYSVVGTMYSGYISLYADQYNTGIYSVGTGPDLQTAEQYAYNGCAGQGGVSCVEVVYGYSFP